MEVIYEDNHLIAVNKFPGEIVQGDKTGDRPLSEILKDYLREKYRKQGNVFLGVVHRLDRPASGVTVFARTGKALSRLNGLFRNNQVRKLYWAITREIPEESEGTLEHYLRKDQQKNKSFTCTAETRNARLARLNYRLAGRAGNYSLLEVELLTGRHHQIRCQLSAIGCPVRGDLKYGYPRSNPDGSISLHARMISFVHPVAADRLVIKAPPPPGPLWEVLTRDIL